MKLKPLRTLTLLIIMIGAFLAGQSRGAHLTNRPPVLRHQVGTNPPNVGAVKPLELESVKAASNQAAKATAPVPAPAPEPAKIPVYVISDASLFRTPAGPLLSTDAANIAALTKLWPITSVTVIWTPDGPVLFCDRAGSDQLRERYQQTHITNLVFYAH